MRPRERIQLGINRILSISAASGNALLFGLTAVGVLIGGANGRRGHLIRALRSSQYKNAQIRDLLHTTLSSIADGVIATDAQGTVTFLNPAARQLTGWAGDEALGHGLDIVFPVVNQINGERLDSPAPKVLREGVVVAPPFETVLFSRDGRAIPIDESAAPIRAGDGAIIGVVLVFRDLTARRRAEQADRSLAAVVEFSNDAIIGEDLDGAITSWNGAATRIFGYDASEMIGGAGAQLIPPGCRDDTPWILELIRAGSFVWRYETPRQKKDGGKIDIELTVSPVRDAAGRIVGASKIARDITGRRRAEHALQASEDRFRRLFDSNLIAIAFWDAEHFISEANDAYLSLIGYTRAEFEPGRISWRDLTPPEYRALDDLALEQARSNSVSKIYEKEYLRRDGKRTAIVIGVAELGKSQDEGLAFALDISERTRMQAQILRSQKLESMSVLAGGIAHDFNNLLMGIIANVSLMIDDAPAESPLTALGENVLAATDQAAHLTRQMLAYSGRGRFAVQSLSLARHVEEITSLVRVSIPMGVRLLLNLAHDLPLIDADASQIFHLVTNLVLNSTEAIALEGVVEIGVSLREIGAEDHPGNLAGAPLPPGPYVMLEVKDTGPGMDQATQARMFDPFFTTKLTGRGLGLAAVLGIVRGHHGGIAVSSEPGKGTTFQVLFPVEQEAAVAQAPESKLGASV